MAKSMLQRLLIRCRHQDKGCEAVVSLDKLVNHEEHCPQLELIALRKEVKLLREKQTSTNLVDAYRSLRTKASLYPKA